MVAGVMAEDWHPLGPPDKPGIRYWRITFYNDEREYVRADILEVDKNNSLVFKRMTIFDAALNKATEYIVNHSVTRDQWVGVTECSKTGVPLWVLDLPEEIQEELIPHPDASDEELEILGMYVEHVMKQVAESAIEKATINSATRKTKDQ